MKKFNTLYEAPWSSFEYIFALDTGGWRSERPIIDNAKCGQCGWCYLYCPVQCIVDKGDYFEVNLAYCKGCGVCVRECPSNAITLVKEEAE